jgi:predicted lipoprotein with Yx(FWY)xxD motif
MRIRSILCGVAALAIAALPAVAADMMAKPVKMVSTDKGPMMTDHKGMTLYIFDKDKAGVSNCKGPCAKNWPPLAAPASAKSDEKFSVIDRGDGSMQWAYKGMPLYTWIKDKKAGDVTGDGFRGVWHVAKP